MRNPPHKAGFTYIEVLLAAFLTGIVAAISSSFVFQMGRDYTTSFTEIEAQNEIRVLNSWLHYCIRNAAFVRAYSDYASWSNAIANNTPPTPLNQGNLLIATFSNGTDYLFWHNTDNSFSIAWRSNSTNTIPNAANSIKLFDPTTNLYQTQLTALNFELIQDDLATAGGNVFSVGKYTTWGLDVAASNSLIPITGIEVPLTNR